MFDTETFAEIISLARQAGIDPAALLAVTEVESGGRALFDVNGVKEPAIRFEGHYFDRRLKGRIRDQARKAGLSAPEAGRVRNPKTQRERWLLLNRAMSIHKNAALESTSWGLGQVMGAHWEWLGYNSIDELVREVRSSVGGQVRLMLNFIDKAGLKTELERKDWRSFARRYNGPAFAHNQYHTRLAAAFERWNRSVGDLIKVA
ncbi:MULTISPECIES: N-acetylmuramidase family protein [Brucella/Ochrobactrum group]|uniref:N-acetylmuramidase family protein n=1 Tax=Brucella/Ochrobactrum group TaxID=2826938 RepID=UPI0016563CF4|nr:MULTISPECIES: N-acetylmuramidase family protein [Brucella/Ochrobactrum group]MBC8718878.1 N-acetylmuramidase family protein [Ochrobactrum sp. Marseille-Q0166]